MAKKTITLQITGPDGATSEATSDLESIIVGSGPGAAVKLADPDVSNLHCMLKVDKSGRLTVIDLGSDTGTMLKNRAVTSPMAVSSGETLVIGGSRLRVVYSEEPLMASGLTPPALRPPQLRPPPLKPALTASPKVVPLAPRAPASKGRDGAALFSEPQRAQAVATETERVLQVALRWGDVLIDVQHFAEGVAVLAGDDKASHFHVFSPGVGSAFPLAQSHGSRITVNVPVDAGVVLTSKNGESQKTREQLVMEGKLKASAGGLRAEAVELALHDRLQLSLEDVSFVIRFVRPSAVISLNTLQEHDFTFFKIVSVSLLAFAALVAAMVITPLATGGEGDDIFANPSKYVKMVIKPEKKHELPKFKDLGAAKDRDKAKDREARQDVLKTKADPTRKPRLLDSNKQEKDRQKVNTLMAGMFGGGASSNLFGGGGLGTGINNALGGLQGASGVGDSQGIGGLGSRGSGTGGSGSGLGLGGVGTKGGGARSKGGYGAIDLGGKAKEGTRIVPGKTTVVGGLDKDVIMKVIKRHQNEIKFCYEQELQKNPSLAGKVAVAWTIDPAGGVSEANVSESSMANANVEACIVQRIRRWKFPEPQGGGVVSVTFPWIFKAAGTDE